MDMKQPQALIFDLDGTLLQTETLSLPAYRLTFQQLRSEGCFVGDTPPEELFLSSLGLLLAEIWENVLPNASDETRTRANELLLDYQIQLLADGYGDLYPGVKETLCELHEHGYQLCVASNGLERYVKGVIQAKGLSHLFVAVYSAGEFRTQTKVELVQHLLQRYQFRSAWMCGDRLSDVEAGRQNGLYVVGCSYGGFQTMGELQDADCVIRDFSEILDILPGVR